MGAVIKSTTVFFKFSDNVVFEWLFFWEDCLAFGQVSENVEKKLFDLLFQYYL